MSDRIRLALLFAVVVATFGLRAGGALGATHAPASGDAVAAYAEKFVGVPYHYGGTTPSIGFDCSGFTRFVYAHFGIDLPHYSVAQYALGKKVARPNLQPGDLVFFRGLGHVGIYVGDGEYIHAPQTGERVRVEPLAAHRAYVGARRVG